MESEQRIKELEKANRVLQKKLERAEHNLALFDRSRHHTETILRSTIEELHTSQALLEVRSHELEQALTDLQIMQTRLLMSEKMSALGVLVAGVAHEINNPVSFIYGNLEPAHEYIDALLNLIQLYQEHYPNPDPTIQKAIRAMDLDFLKVDLPELLGSMQMGAERIKNIVLSLRTFSRMDEAELKTVDLHAGIDSTLVILEHRLKAQHDRPAIQVIKEYGDLPLVKCYAGQLNQVFMNILVNAIDAVEERLELKNSSSQVNGNPAKLPSTISNSYCPTIKISTQASNNQVIICIADNGSGIPETIQQRLFDPFFTTKPVGKGTGMGLSISYQIITERHGGNLCCFSCPGKGTHFVIELPIKIPNAW
jgi:signal transduction histidine kinase